VSGVDLESGKEPSSARELFGAELRRLRLLREVSQEQLAVLVVHSRALIAAVELAGRWPPRDFGELAVTGPPARYHDPTDVAPRAARSQETA
jgi:hypothetical protein